jgi:CheY-like chemotaxis protein
VTPKLLLADDSVTIQRVIELTFADEDVQVLAVGDGRQAIERVEADRPDIVLADVGMPERDGYEVAAFIKGHPQLSHIPVLLLTGAFEPIDEARARAVGCDGVLVKPFEPQMVISRVRDLLSGKRTTEEAGRFAGVPGPTLVSAGSQPGGIESAAPVSGQSASLEDYFDRLDAALATMNGPSAAPLPVLDRSEAPPVEPIAPIRPSEPQTTPVVAPAPTPAVADLWEPPALQGAFAALLAAERGQPLPAPPGSAPHISDELIDEIARRVIVRMGDEAMRTAVLDAAERLVRQEIDRIKSQR